MSRKPVMQDLIRVIFKPTIGTVAIIPLVVGNRSLAARLPAVHTVAMRQETPTLIPDTLIKQVDVGPTGEWVVLNGLNGYVTSGLADPVVAKLSAINDAKEEIQWITFGPDGAWLISSAKSFYYDKLPPDLSAEVDAGHSKRS